MRVPFPNGEPMDAWKARVGTVWLRRVTHCLVTQVGTRSHLFTMSTRCLCAACFRRYTSRWRQRVPGMLRASSTCSTTSLQSMTL